MCVRDDRQDGYGGVAILVQQSINYSPLHFRGHVDGLQIVGVIVENTAFISTYIPYPSINLISELSKLLSTVIHSIVLLGDLNCHHVAWGCSFSDKHGERLLDLTCTQFT